MSEINTGGGGAIGGDASIGRDFSGRDSSKGFQQVSIDLRNLSDRDMAEIVRMVPRLNEVIFGDGYKWVGLVKHIEDIARQLNLLATREEVEKLAIRLERIEHDISRKPSTDYDQRVMIGLMIAVCVMALAIAYGAYILANGAAA